MAATDYMASAILLPMLGRLRLASPGSRLAVFELQPARLEQQAASDEVDLFFHTREGAPPGLHQRLLFRERYVLAGRAGHPALRLGLARKRSVSWIKRSSPRTEAASARRPISRWRILA